jgi:hypothetical protein
VQAVFVGPTGDFTAHYLQRNHKKYELVKAQFYDTWIDPKFSRPKVQRIYYIRVSPGLQERYFAAKQKFGNSNLFFHGTSQSPNCYFGVNQSKGPCASDECRVCSICRQSFRLDSAGAEAGRVMQLRYGKGLYFAPVSSKSHSYNTGSAKNWSGKELRCMFLCEVAQGKSFVTQEGFLDQATMCPPPGYNSVNGVPGKELNYPEVCVYSQEQILPKFLIVYTSN